MLKSPPLPSLSVLQGEGRNHNWYHNQGFHPATFDFSPPFLFLVGVNSLLQFTFYIENLSAPETSFGPKWQRQKLKVHRPSPRLLQTRSEGTQMMTMWYRVPETLFSMAASAAPMPRGDQA